MRKLRTEGIPMKPPRNTESEAEAIKAYERFIAALNAGDQETMFKVMHVPHIRISGSGVVIYETKEIPVSYTHMTLPTKA